jgi:hypothetical protein
MHTEYIQGHTTLNVVNTAAKRVINPLRLNMALISKLRRTSECERALIRLNRFFPGATSTKQLLCRDGIVYQITDVNTTIN